MQHSLLWFRRGGIEIVPINAIFTETNGFISTIAPKIHIFHHNHTLLCLVNAAIVPCSNKVNITVEVNNSLRLELKCQIGSVFNMFYEGIIVLYHHKHFGIKL